MKILILGCSGLIGSTLFRVLSENAALDTNRDSSFQNSITKLKDILIEKIVTGVDVADDQILFETIKSKKPNVIINCIGITKHVEDSSNILDVININTILPHKIAKIADTLNSKLIHISTDCVFSGKDGSYSELGSKPMLLIYMANQKL